MFTRWRDFSLHLGRLAVQGCPFYMQDIRMKGELGRHTSPPSFLSRAKKETRLWDVLWWLLLQFGTSLSWVIDLKQRTMDFQWNLFDHLIKPSSLYLLCLIRRRLCSLQWQFVRLQPSCPWCTYSGGPTSADHPTGKMPTYDQTPWIYHDCVRAGVTLYQVVSDVAVLPTNRGQCCKLCRRQPRGFRQATSTTYSLCILTQR